MTIKTGREFHDQVLCSPVPVLAEFRAAGDPPTAGLRSLAGTGAVRMCTVDVTAQPMLPGQFGVLRTPAVLLFRSGRVTAAALGAQACGVLAEQLADGVR